MIVWIEIKASYTTKLCVLHSHHTDIFSMVKPNSLGKNWKFCISLVWDKMGLETISDDHLHVVKEKTSPP